MKHIGYTLTLLSLLFIASCSDSGEQTTAPAAIDVPVSFVTMNGDASMAVANLSIEGMTCEIGCAGKIRKELSTIAGVINTEVDFDENSKLDVAKVQFDPEQVDAYAMIEKVHEIMDGIYVVKSVEVINFEQIQKENEEAGEGASLSLNLRDLIPLPQLFQVIHK